MAAVCPICFEEGQAVEYAHMHNHSWQNVRCDAHGICWDCLNRYVELQILDEGRFNLKCPGIGCAYRLLPLDVERALERSSAERQELALARYSSMRSASHGERLREVVLGASGPSQCWLLQECQVCPRCLSLVRRETGCNHVFCRCGCEFCVACGSPDECLCSQLVMDTNIVFAAWLRISPDSPVAWLKDAVQPSVPERLLTTLAFWLWMAYIPVDVPWARALEEEPEAELPIPPLRWRNNEGEWLYINEEEAFEEASFTQIVHHPVDRFSPLAYVDGEEAEDFFQDYQRAPRRPWRLFATQRDSRRQDRHHYVPLRWKDVRPWTGDDAAAPLRRRRQPRAVAAGARAAEQAAAAARKVEELRRRRQKSRRCFREELVQME